MRKTGRLRLLHELKRGKFSGLVVYTVGGQCFDVIDVRGDPDGEESILLQSRDDLGWVEIRPTYICALATWGPEVDE